jgi:hypothetical protein
MSFIAQRPLTGRLGIWSVLLRGFNHDVTHHDEIHSKLDPQVKSMGLVESSH